MKRIGHKGADLIRPGNTLESFEAAVDAGAEMIELDVLRPKAEFGDGADWRRAAAGPVDDGAPPLLVAHDWGDAARRSPMRFDEVMDAFTRPPLNRVAIDLDLKIAGRENEVLTTLGERNLIGRASISTMEVSSLTVLQRARVRRRHGLDPSQGHPRLELDAVGTPARRRSLDLAAGAAPGRRAADRPRARRERDLGLPPRGDRAPCATSATSRGSS